MGAWWLEQSNCSDPCGFDTKDAMMLSGLSFAYSMATNLSSIHPHFSQRCAILVSVREELIEERPQPLTPRKGQLGTENHPIGSSILVLYCETHSVKARGDESGCLSDRS